MKKTIAFLSFILALVPVARAADIALLYVSTTAAAEGHAWPAPLVDGGAALPADVALGASSTLLYGDGDGLFRGSITRLDTDLNIAVVRRGERVGDAALQASHAARFQGDSVFLKISAPAVVASSAPASPVAPSQPVGDQPFAFKIDGQEPGETPITLRKLLNKAKMKLEVINTSTAPVWSIDVTVTAEPSLSFWKSDRHTGLNDVPTKTFEYKQQAVFTPIRPGQEISQLVDVYFIKEKDYIFHLSAKSKGLSAERKAFVRFE